MDVFDVIIHVKEDQIARNESTDTTTTVKPLDDKVNRRVPIIDFDPVQQYLDQLIDCYSRFALFFYDRFGGHDIGVAFKPSVFESHPFDESCVDLSKVLSTVDQSGRNNIDINIEALIEDFAVIGEGIVDRVEVKSQQWSGK